MAELFAKNTISPSPKPSPELLRRKYIYVPKYEIIVGTSPKCGTRSLLEALKEEVTYFVTTFDRPTFFIVREPIERFCSLWRDKARDRTKVNRGQDELVWGTTPEELMDVLESGMENHHWITQTDIADNKYDHLVPFEDLPEWWETLTGNQFPHKNKSEGEVKLTPELIERLQKFYIEDIRLYEKALDEYGD